MLFCSITITYLPPYHPNEEEMSNPIEFAGNVQLKMAKILGREICLDSYKDHPRLKKKMQRKESKKLK